MASPNYDAIDRVLSILDPDRPTDYVGFCDLLTELAHYAASKSWDLVDEAGIAVRIAARREAA